MTPRGTENKFADEPRGMANSMTFADSSTMEWLWTQINCRNQHDTSIAPSHQVLIVTSNLNRAISKRDLEESIYQHGIAIQGWLQATMLATIRYSTTADNAIVLLLTPHSNTDARTH